MDDLNIPLLLRLRAAWLVLTTAARHPLTPHHLDIDPDTNTVSLTPINHQG